MESDISVTLVYSPKAREVLELALSLTQGCTVSEAIRTSRILDSVTSSDLQALELGIWGKKVPSSYMLQDGDRIEIYRPLSVDPKVARRERFAKQGARTTGLFARRRPGGQVGLLNLTRWSAGEAEAARQSQLSVRSRLRRSRRCAWPLPRGRGHPGRFFRPGHWLG